MAPSETDIYVDKTILILNLDIQKLPRGRLKIPMLLLKKVTRQGYRSKQNKTFARMGL